MNRVHKRASSQGSKMDLCQLVDWDRDGELIVVIKDLETDETLREVSIGLLRANSPVLVSLRYKWREYVEPAK
jgi:hypothetical protein